MTRSFIPVLLVETDFPASSAKATITIGKTQTSKLGYLAKSTNTNSENQTNKSRYAERNSELGVHTVQRQAT